MLSNKRTLSGVIDLVVYILLLNSFKGELKRQNNLFGKEMYQNLWWCIYLENLNFIKLLELIVNEQLKFKVII